jgi:hypothetical protein
MSTWEEWEKPLAHDLGEAMPEFLRGASGIVVAAWAGFDLQHDALGRVVAVGGEAGERWCWTGSRMIRAYELTLEDFGEWLHEFDLLIAIAHEIQVDPQAAGRRRGSVAVYGPILKLGQQNLF